MSNVCIIHKILLDKDIYCSYEELKAIDYVIFDNNEKLTICKMNDDIEDTLIIIRSLINDLRKKAV